VERDFDLRRLHELPELLGSELPVIVATLLTELTRTTDQVREAIGSSDWAAAAEAAHAARNSALMLDAGPLLETLARVELAAANADRAAAETARTQLEQTWPALRSGLEAAIRQAS
jgi:HPt (histidine-containing phosphotransfer) domain-containing protein